MFVYLKSIAENRPGSKWSRQFHKTWPYYRKWFLSEGYRARPGYLTSRTELEKYMPELVGTYDRLVDLAGGGDLESRFLSQYCPPPYMTGCSQVAWNLGEPFLMRNYDYSPVLFEGVLLKTNWLKTVIGISDCSWGLLDGINGSGLAVSLTFGGRKITGTGFGIPLILRYILEVCDTVQEAREKLLALPVHMAYNVTVTDPTGAYLTAYLAPDRQPILTDSPIGTNHQGQIDWEDYAKLTATVERKQFLESCLADPLISEAELYKKFLQPPLYNTYFEKSFGTLYTAVYHPKRGSVKVSWPGKSLVQSFETFNEGKEVVNLKKSISRKLTL